MHQKIVVYTDGGSRGNPGQAACSFVVYQDEKILHKNSFYLGVATNNDAEYMGVIKALEWLTENFSKENLESVTFYVDSELLVKQITGVYKIKNRNLQERAEEVMQLIKRLSVAVDFRHVLRNKNKIADKLVNETLDKVRENFTS